MSRRGYYYFCYYFYYLEASEGEATGALASSEMRRTGHPRPRPPPLKMEPTERSLLSNGAVGRSLPLYNDNSNPNDRKSKISYPFLGFFFHFLFPMITLITFIPLID